MSDVLAPNPAALCATARMIEAAIITAGHKGCGLSFGQHSLLLDQVSDLYATAAWIEAQQNGPTYPLRLWAKYRHRSGQLVQTANAISRGKSADRSCAA